ncbi:uncharacterized mitochondrial protein AtMg00810-like [Nicotiana sylvestris]|uniref:uncharacterized mitochondrial protein AtMg00810-like n=1 Tax=Nicotiana sylvestris TaxID=4096 RepID=UPI00388C9D70
MGIFSSVVEAWTFQEASKDPRWVEVMKHLELIEATKVFLQQAFKIKDLGELKFFLGMEFSRSNKGILINQRKYALEIISDMGLSGAKPAWTPLETNIKLIVPELDKLMCTIEDQILADVGQYQKLIGKLFCHKSSIKRELGLGILLSSQNSSEINVFCDADWTSCPNIRKSVSGYQIKLGESPVSSKSKKQNTLSKSSAEAEYRSMASAVSKVVWLAALLKELGT